MKRKQFILLSSFLAWVLILFAACETDTDNKNINKVPPSVSSDDLLAPYLRSFSSYLSWDKVSNATSYDIYSKNYYIGTTKQTTYQLNEIENDLEYYVIAKNGEKESEKSNSVLVSKNCNFTSDEILNLTNQSSYSTAISSSVRKIIIGKDYSCSFSLNANILERTTDLIFEIHNVDITGSIFTYNGIFSRTKNNFNVIFDLIGDCKIRGDDGYKGFDFSSSRYDNSELAAGKGGDGNNAIVVPTAIIKGLGNFSIVGGNGGAGGIGASTTTWESTNAPGKGSDGGNGGAGIKTSYFILNMDNGGNSVAVIDGKGGKKGKPGKNGSIITGPPASLMWDDIYDIGKAGLDGKSSFGTKKILNGKLIY